MRVNERVAFLRSIEQEIADLEEIEYEQHRDVEFATVCQEAVDLEEIAINILAHFDLEAYAAYFVDSPDGLAILANCCNCAAKQYDCTLYEHKPYLIGLATQDHPECWQDEGIVYIETRVGQVSFHALYGEDEGLPEANGRVWSGLEYQINAQLVAHAWLEGWNKAILEQVIITKSKTIEIAA